MSNIYFRENTRYNYCCYLLFYRVIVIMNWPPLRPASWDLKRPHKPFNTHSTTEPNQYIRISAPKYIWQIFIKNTVWWGPGLGFGSRKAEDTPACPAKPGPPPSLSDFGRNSHQNFVREDLSGRKCYGLHLLLPCWGPGSFHFQNGELRGKDWQWIVLAHGNGCFFWALWDAVVLVRT